jgi:hypothetical protein
MKTSQFGPGDQKRVSTPVRYRSSETWISPEDRERVADNVLRDYRGLYDDVERAHALISQNLKKQRIAKIWKEAHHWLNKLTPLFRMDHDIPEVEIRMGKPLTVGDLEKQLAPVRGMDRVTVKLGERLKATDLVTGGVLLWLTQWLDSWISRSGPRGSAAVVQAAYMLAEISKLNTNRTDWNWVREKIERWFPECGHHKNDWIRDRVKKFKRGRVAKYRQLRERPPFTFGFDINPSSNPNQQNDNLTTPEEAAQNMTVFILRRGITPPSAIFARLREQGRKRTSRRNPAKRNFTRNEPKIEDGGFVAPITDDIVKI